MQNRSYRSDNGGHWWAVPMCLSARFVFCFVFVYFWNFRGVLKKMCVCGCVFVEKGHGGWADMMGGCVWWYAVGGKTKENGMN